MASMLSSSEVNRRLKSPSGQTKDYKLVFFLLFREAHSDKKQEQGRHWLKLGSHDRVDRHVEARIAVSES